MDNQLRHLAIMPDGNGRWAMNRNMPRFEGHEVGYDVTKRIVLACTELNIPYLTCFVLSSDNLTRQKDEVSHLLDILANKFSADIGLLTQKNIILNPIGNYSLLKNKKISSLLEHAYESTKSNTGTQVNIAVGYNGMDDILQSAQRAYQTHDISLNKDALKKCMYELSYLRNSPPVDFCIRTGGEFRLSNFCLWHLAYAEFYFTDVLWPDFSREEFNKALEAYNKRQRRFGKEYHADI